MAETVTKQEVCAEVWCADVRGESAFCYGCGHEIAGSEASASETVVPASDIATGRQVDVSSADADQLTGEKSVEIQSKDSSIDKKSAKTAANIRRRPRKPLQTVDYVWEKPDTPRVPFIIAGIVLAMVTAVLIFFANYLK